MQQKEQWLTLLDQVIDRQCVVDLFVYGSQIYKTAIQTPTPSDIDVLVVTNEKTRQESFFTHGIDFHFMPLNEFEQQLADFDISVLDCYFSPLRTFDHHYEFDDLLLAFEQCRIDRAPYLAKLRKSVSQWSSNSWVKAKKKITLPNENTWIGFKSLYHSIRMVEFGNQIATMSRITDHTALNSIFYDLLEAYQDNKTWDDLSSHYKPLLNKMLTELRKNAPKC